MNFTPMRRDKRDRERGGGSAGERAGGGGAEKQREGERDACMITYHMAPYDIDMLI